MSVFRFQCLLRCVSQSFFVISNVLLIRFYFVYLSSVLYQSTVPVLVKTLTKERTTSPGRLCFLIICWFSFWASCRHSCVHSCVHSCWFHSNIFGGNSLDRISSTYFIGNLLLYGPLRKLVRVFRVI